MIENSISIPGLDTRLRVFRRSFADIEEFANMRVDAYVLLSQRYVVVCDSMLCPADMAEVMQSIRSALTAERQILLLNSHADFDHCWGNSYFTGEHSATIIAHQLCHSRMQSEQAQLELAYYQSRYALFQDVVLTPPTITFTHNLSIYGGDLTIELIAAPGHTSDHIAAWLPELSLLLAFDAIEFPLPHIENAANVQSMFATLQHFLTLQPQHVLCSHGKSDNPSLIRDNLAYLRAIEQRCCTLLLTHYPSEDELEHDPSELINYPFSEIVADIHEPLDHTYYREVHDDNIRSIMRQAQQDYHA